MIDLDFLGTVPVIDESAHIKYYHDLVQGSDEWLALRRGIITASEMHFILTPTLKVASNKDEKTHMYELATQRITDYVEPHYISDDMIRGNEDEIEARNAYSEHYHPVVEVGFITNNSLGFVIGYSPDGIVGDDGLIECKSRRQKHQLATLIKHVAAQTIPDEYMLQIQTGLWVTKRKWCDFISYCGGMEMVTIRVYPDAKIQAAIVEAATQFESKILEIISVYKSIIGCGLRLIPTVRRVEQDII